jgi:dTDP-4-amino-4,6-dideoxygalactose transaminase
MIPLNKPARHGRELAYIAESIAATHISGDGPFTERCQAFFRNRYGFLETLMTTSCTTALEMSAILLNIQAGDEVIVPAYTFSSTANAFAIHGARIVFADSSPNHPNIDVNSIENLISPRTRAIVVVHYAGNACEMDTVLELAQRYEIAVIEDAAHSIDAFYKDQPLGGLGTMSTFSFHQTKNVAAGEGGLLVINEGQYIRRAEVIRQYGTNRSEFRRGETDKYTCVDIGSSAMPSELNAAYLLAQLEYIDAIQERRVEIWQRYMRHLHAGVRNFGVETPELPEWSTNNGHAFYLTCASIEQRTALIDLLRSDGVQAAFHYKALHKSPFFARMHDGRALAASERFSDCLLRLPLFYELTDDEVDFISERVLTNLALQPGG